MGHAGRGWSGFRTPNVCDPSFRSASGPKVPTLHACPRRHQQIGGISGPHRQLRALVPTHFSLIGLPPRGVVLMHGNKIGPLPPLVSPLAQGRHLHLPVVFLTCRVETCIAHLLYSSLGRTTKSNLEPHASFEHKCRSGKSQWNLGS